MHVQKERLAALALSLDEAAASGSPLPPLTETEPALTLDDAYRIQLLNVERMLDRGQMISGKKIGLTSKAMQDLMGVGEPDYGHLFQSMDRADGVFEADALLQPKVEGEIAFVLKEDICGPNATVEDVLAATDYISASLEIVASRIKDWNIKLVDTVADNASSGMYVLGEVKLDPRELNLPEIEMSFYKNGELVNSGKGADVLGNPAYCVAWLANKLHQYGVTLKKGEVVLSGALSAALPATKGDDFEARFTHLGSVSARFV